ncbi:MAG: putative molybdenum carrier protein [Betaproteobacteria bacterium]|nr:putative molybdenum carrier protein [Betaproteobacteria bacterium]
MSTEADEIDRRFASITFVSGGQTGADRAALDWAIARRIAHGGWCPRGRLAEDGSLADRYRLRETTAEDYAQRTQWNVRDSDATLIVSIAPDLTGGSRLTRMFADELGKPCVHVTPESFDASQVRAFLVQHGVRVLNVAGPRASKDGDVYAFTWQVLDAVFPVTTQTRTRNR